MQPSDSSRRVTVQASYFRYLLLESPSEIKSRKADHWLFTPTQLSHDKSTRQDQSFKAVVSLRWISKARIA